MIVTAGISSGGGLTEARWQAREDGGGSVSFGQERMFVIEQLEDMNGAYNLGVEVELPGSIDVDALSRAVARVVNRHHVLVNGFGWQDGELRVAAGAPLSIDLHEIVTLGDRSGATGLEAIREFVLTRFDLEKGPLLRAGLFSDDSETYRFVIAVHHSAADEWSVGILLREMMQAYSGEKLPEVNMQYSAFARHQREALDSLRRHELATYWKSRLSGVVENILPPNFPRPVRRSYEGRRHLTVVSQDVLAGLKAVARRKKCTLFMVLLATLKAVMSRYGGQTDISVGTPISLRDNPDVEGTVGFFVNTIVLRDEVRDDGSFGHLIDQVKETALAAYDKSDFPFEQLVAELKVDRDLSRSPVFQVFFVHQNAATGKLKLGDDHLSVRAVDINRSIYDLSVLVREDDDELNIILEYSAELFEPAFIEQLGDAFSFFLEQVCETIDQRISRFKLLRPQKQEALLSNFCKSSSPALSGEITLPDLFKKSCDEAPLSTAVTDGTISLSYADLDASTNAIAQNLIALGAGPEKVIGVCLSRSVALIEALLGTLKSGAAYLPLDPSYPVDRLKHMIADSNVACVIHDDASQSKLSDCSAKAIPLSALKTEAGRASSPSTGLLPDNSAYIIYTSGSTGLPKGVTVTHRNLCNYVIHDADEALCCLGRHSRVLQLASYSFDTSVAEIWSGLGNGAALYVPASQKYVGADLATLLRVSKATVATLQPSLLASMEKTALPELDTLVVAGEACRWDLVEPWLGTVTVINAYGPTETTVACSMSKLATTGPYMRPLIGRPVAGTRLYVLDGNYDHVPVGVAGELFIAGAGVSRGYHNKASLTAERFLPDPFATDGSRMYRSGDLARWTGSGQLEYLGRADQQIKFNGYRIEPGEIESAIRASLPTVHDCVVVMDEDTERGKQLVAYIALPGTEDLVAADLRSKLGKVLPAFMIPSHFVQLDKLPLTPNKKVDRKALPKPHATLRAASTDYREPTTDVEKKIASIWASVLGVDRVGLDDNFFELGGTSLQAVNLQRQIGAQFGGVARTSDIFASRTLAVYATIVGLQERSSQKADRRNKPRIRKSQRRPDPAAQI